MKECSKFILRRINDRDLATRYFVGSGVDIGGAPDPLLMYREFFPLMRDVKTWDWEDGDAQHMEGVADDTFDFVFSSHCLEHLRDPVEGLATWLRVLKPGGHMILLVPDEDMYEQGVWPSDHNRDHKTTFTCYKERSWSPRSVSLLPLIMGLGPQADLRRIEVVDQSFRQSLPRFDQTLTPVAECAIEIIVRKRAPAEIEAGGRFLRQTEQPPADQRRYLNQYRADWEAVKRGTDGDTLFKDETPI